MGQAAAPDFGPTHGLTPASGSAGTNPGGCGGEPTIASIQQTVFDKGCAFGSCHAGATPAAKLDLSKGHACASLVNRQSCVFNQKTRVVPGHPEQSYLYSKIVGHDLGSNPDGPCAGLTHGAPQRMPLGGEPLCQEAIDQVAAWITAGAHCDGEAPDGGTPGDGGTDAPVDSGPQIASLTATARTVAAGATTTIVLTLAHPAPGKGVTIPLAVSDPTVLAAPGEVIVPPGAINLSFEVRGARPARGKLSAGAAEVEILVTGLELAEILYMDDYGATSAVQWVKIHNATGSAIDLSKYSLGAGSGSYVETQAQLTGLLAPGACEVIGGPVSRPANGSPTLTQLVRFTPELDADGRGAGVAIFDSPATKVSAVSLPLDALVYGSGNPGGLLHPDGSVAKPDAPDIFWAGDSLLKTASGWRDTYPTTPNRCP
jgi:hypothetical protein